MALLGVVERPAGSPVLQLLTLGLQASPGCDFGAEGSVVVGHSRLGVLCCCKGLPQGCCGLRGLEGAAANLGPLRSSEAAHEAGGLRIRCSSCCCMQPRMKRAALGRPSGPRRRTSSGTQAHHRSSPAHRGTGREGPQAVAICRLLLHAIERVEGVKELAWLLLTAGRQLLGEGAAVRAALGSVAAEALHGCNVCREPHAAETLAVEERF